MSDSDKRDKEIEWRNEAMAEVRSVEEAVEKIIQHEIEGPLREATESLSKAVSDAVEAWKESTQKHLDD